jgi:uncharacterized membrane protein (UPF0127 family)
VAAAGSVALAGFLSSASVSGKAPGWAVAVLPSGTELSIEIAADDAARQRGYMFRESVGPREGMLFVFDAPGQHAIWMRNCLVPLDILWLDKGFQVVEMAVDRQPCPPQGDCPSFVPMRLASYVLEVAAGTAREQKLAIGDRIQVLWGGSPRE